MVPTVRLECTKHFLDGIVVWRVWRKVDQLDASAAGQQGSNHWLALLCLAALPDSYDVVDGTVVNNQNTVLLRPWVHVLQQPVNEVKKQVTVEGANAHRDVQNPFESYSRKNGKPSKVRIIQPKNALTCRHGRSWIV